MSQLSQEKPEGNTISSGTRHQLYRWFFTIPYEEYTASQLSQELKTWSKSFLFSGEVGESGYKHWQGCFSLKTKEYFHTVKNLFSNKAHIEPCKVWQRALNYCQKEDTHYEGPYDEKYCFLELPQKLFTWQSKVIDICLTKPDNRTINWFYDLVGNKGKTMLCKYLYVHFGACVVGNGALKDIAHSISINPTLVVFNITRSNEDHINYGAIEACKDGLLFSPKYESHMKVFNSPHIFVFSNFRPKEHMMSLDRWNIVEIEAVELGGVK